MSRLPANRHWLSDVVFGSTVGIIAASVLAVAALAFVVIIQSQAPANAAYLPVDTITCDNGEHGDFHIHAHVSISINSASTAAIVRFASSTLKALS